MDILRILDSEPLLKMPPIKAAFSSDIDWRKLPLCNNSLLPLQNKPKMANLQFLARQNKVTWAQVEAENANNSLGGKYVPEKCRTKHKVAILIPYRDRDKELKILLHRLHSMLQRQKISYGIYVIEQVLLSKKLIFALIWLKF